MKSIRVILILVSCIIFSCSSPFFEGKVIHSFDNNSSIKPLIGILDFEYSNRMVHPNALINQNDERISFALSSKRRWRNKLKDSVLVVFLDPSLISLESTYLLSKKDADIINSSPSCVLVKYILSRQQFNDPSYYCRFFPPNDNMKDVYMIPSFQEVMNMFNN